MSHKNGIHLVTDQQNTGPLDNPDGLQKIILMLFNPRLSGVFFLAGVTALLA